MRRVSPPEFGVKEALSMTVRCVALRMLGAGAEVVASWI